LNPLDHFVKEKLGITYYGRYVDDFLLIHQDQSFLRGLIPQVQDFLSDHLELELHPRKIYLQHYTKGASFLGVYLKPHRNHVSRRIKNNFFQAIQEWNRHIVESGNKLNRKDLQRFIASMNSYLGAMKHYDTYKLRKKMLLQLNGYFWNYVYISGGYAKLVPKIKRLRSKS
jgi:hypothetical protein